MSRDEGFSLAPRFSALDPLSVFDSKVIWREGFDRRTAEPRANRKGGQQGFMVYETDGKLHVPALASDSHPLASSPIKVAC